MVYTNVAKPTGPVYNNTGPRTYYNDPNVTYSQANVFYNGANPNPYTPVAKPSSTSYTNIPKPV